jgi:hypothetical protein
VGVKPAGSNPQAYRVHNGAPDPPENRDHYFQLKIVGRYYDILMRINEHQKSKILAFLQYRDYIINVFVIILSTLISQ